MRFLHQRPDVKIVDDALGELAELPSPSAPRHREAGRKASGCTLRARRVHLRLGRGAGTALPNTRRAAAPLRRPTAAPQSCGRVSHTGADGDAVRCDKFKFWEEHESTALSLRDILVHPAHW